MIYPDNDIYIIFKCMAECRFRKHFAMCLGLKNNKL